MSCSFSFQITKALPCLPQPQCRKSPLCIQSKYKPIQSAKLDKVTVFFFPLFPSLQYKIP